MKLAKLSLAAIMTFGAISVVNAQPLEEAFKDVEFTGFLRYRNDQRDVDGHSVNVKDSPTINQNDWDFMSKFSSPVGDNFKVVTVFASSSGGTKGENQTGNSNTELKVDLRKAFLAYGKDDLTVEAGQMAIGHPIFDNAFNGNKGNGVIGKYAIGQVTLASSYFAGANVWDVGDASSAYDDNNVCEGFCNKDEGSITTAAITGSFSDLEGQFWYAKIQDYIEAQYFAQADAKVAMFNATAQFINTTLDDNKASDAY
ncbi:MAG: major outer membrane protein, partial [Sulfurospirillum sp.]|nr:major outer membrane protein [Sulfurospirillum sp.]